MKWDGTWNAGFGPAFSLAEREGRGKRWQAIRSLYEYEGFLDKS